MSTSTPEPADSNDLQRWIFEFRQSVDRNINKIILAVVVLTIATVAYQVVTRNAASKKAAQWNDYHACKTGDDFKKVAEKYPGTVVANWARLEAARQYVADGTDQSVTNREASDENLNNAKTQLESLLSAPGTPPEVRELALAQLIVCLESLCDGNTQPVVDACERLIQDFPNSQNTPWAKKRLEALKSPVTGEFYTWFRKSKPSPAERPKPQDIKPSEAPNVKLEGEGEVPASSAAPDSKPMSETAPAAESKPAETPAEPAKSRDPAAATPGEPAPPATDKPADPPAAPNTDTPAPAPEKSAEVPAEPAKP